MSEWKRITISDFSAYYSISDNGDVYSHRAKRILKHKIGKNGYHRVTLGNGKGKQKTVLIHRLVALAFVDNPDNKPTVNHINENKSDNRAVNLEWMTTAEQNKHGTRTVRAVKNTDWNERTKKIDYNIVAKKHDYSKQNMCNRKRCVVFKNGVTVGEYDTLKRAAKAVGANYSKASEVANGKRKTTNGYNFKYIEEFPMAVTKYHFGEE